VGTGNPILSVQLLYNARVKEIAVLRLLILVYCFDFLAVTKYFN